jgi:hypothetical protein
MPCQKNMSLPKSRKLLPWPSQSVPFANAPVLATVSSFIIEDSQMNHSDIEQSTPVTDSEQLLS